MTCEECARSSEGRNGGLFCHAWLIGIEGDRVPMRTIRGLKLRCFFFKAQRGAEDQRPGKERWPCTKEEFETAHRRRVPVWWAWMLDKPKARV